MLVVWTENVVNVVEQVAVCSLTHCQRPLLDLDEVINVDVNVAQTTLLPV